MNFYRFVKPIMLLAAGLASTLHAQTDTSAAAAVAAPFPLQLEAEVPYAPTAFLSDGKQRLVYELVLRNFERGALELRELAVFASTDVSTEPLAAFDAEQLRTMTRIPGIRPADVGPVPPLQGGASAIIYLLLSFPADAQVPAQLHHRIRTASGDLITDGIGTQQDTLQTLGAPVTGSGWLAETGLSNDNGHRRGNLVLNGKSVISRRYAFDWMKVDAAGGTHSGDEHVNAAYYSHGEPLIAVADATVMAVTDGIGENVIGTRPSGPPAFDTIAGNNVVLDIGEGHYAHYMHMQPGSLRVKVGDRVSRGDVLGAIGNSGDSFAPHLHFEVTTSPASLAGEGVPYVIEAFRSVHGERGTAMEHYAELPLEKSLVDFDSP